MHYTCICAILLAVAEKTSGASVSQVVLGEGPTSSATEEELDCPGGPASRLSALILGKELGARPVFPVLALRPIRPNVDIPDQAKRFGSSALSGYLFFTNRTLACALPPLAGHRLCTTARRQLKSAVCGLNSLHPALRSGSPLFKSSTPAQARGSCAFAFFAPWQTETPELPFWKEKLRSKDSLFPSKTESKGFLEGKGRTRANG